MKIGLLFFLLIATAGLNAIEGKWWNHPLQKKKESVEQCPCTCQATLCEEDCSKSCFEGSLTLGGGWVYLSPREQNLEYARILEQTNSNGVTMIQGNRKCSKWNFSSGYEVVASFQGKCVDVCVAWDLKGVYTSYQNSADTLLSVSSPKFIFPLIGFIPDEDSNRFLSTQVSNHIDYQNGIAEFGWSFCSACPLALRMSVGAEYASIKESLKVDYLGSAINSQLQLATQVSMRPKMDGVGPRIGLNGYWDAYCGLGMIGSLSTALLISKLQGNLSQTSVDIVSEFSPLFVDWNEKYCSSVQLIPNIQVRLGLTWSATCFEYFLFSIEGGYQAAYYFGPLQKLKVTDNDFRTFVSSENFGLDGYFINASISF